MSVTYFDGAAGGFDGAAGGMLGAACRLAVKSEERSREKIAVLIGGFFIVFVFTPNAGVIIGLQGKKTKGSIWHFFD